MIELKEKKVLITGGSRGIGRAAALLFAGAGCDVAINYVQNSEKALDVQRKVEKYGRKCLAVKADISNESSVESMIKKIEKEWGELDIVVNNAGIWTYGEMGNMEASIWKQTMQINLDGVFHVCNAAIPLLKKSKNGSIIMVSSTAGVRGEAFHSHYAASKGALISLTKSLACELAPYKIRVNCVAPGWVDTDMCIDLFKKEGFKEKIRKSIPLERIPDPEDIAGPILFLASKLACHITGEILNVNGGSVLCG